MPVTDQRKTAWEKRCGSRGKPPLLQLLHMANANLSIAQAASRIGEVVSVQVIARPHEELSGMLNFTKAAQAASASSSKNPKSDGA